MNDREFNLGDEILHQIRNACSAVITIAITKAILKLISPSKKEEPKVDYTVEKEKE